jgi:hypothetical protein
MFGLLKNFKLNIGGFIGAVLAVVGVCVVLFSLTQNGKFPRFGFRLLFFAALGGAAFGNWVWSLSQPNLDEWPPSLR